MMGKTISHYLILGKLGGGLAKGGDFHVL